MCRFVLLLPERKSVNVAEQIHYRIGRPLLPKVGDYFVVTTVGEGQSSDALEVYTYAFEKRHAHSPLAHARDAHSKDVQEGSVVLINLLDTVEPIGR